MPQDRRITMASSRLGVCTRSRLGAEAIANARRDLSAAQIEVAIDRALTASALPLTREQITRLTARLTFGCGL